MRNVYQQTCILFREPAVTTQFIICRRGTSKFKKQQAALNRLEKGDDPPSVFLVDKLVHAKLIREVRLLQQASL